MATTPRIDQGIVLYATDDGSGSYTTAKGTAGTVKTLTNANYIVSDEFYVGGTADLVITVGGVISVGMASAVVILEAQCTDAKNPTVPKWAVIGTARGDAPGSSPAASQTIARANLAGQSVDDGGVATEVLDVRLLTTDHRLSNKCRVIVTATNAPNAGDKIIVSVNSGGA